MNTELETVATMLSSAIEIVDKKYLPYYSTFINGIIAYAEEIILTKHVHVGSTDGIDVVSLLLRDLLCALGIKDMEGFRTSDRALNECVQFLKDLQKMEEKRLSRLKQKLHLLRQSEDLIQWIKELKKDMHNRHEKEYEMQDLRKSVAILTTFLQRMKDVSQSYNDELRNAMAQLGMDIQKYNEEVSEVKMITKRALGKMVVRHVGNEGIGEQSDLRRLFQTCIDFIQKTPPQIWSDASITIYDDQNDQIFTIKSGKEKHQYICSMRDNEPTITKRAVNEAPSCCQM